MSITDPTMVQHADKPRVVADNTTNTSRGLPDDLQRFAKAGLDLKVGDFRKMCQDLGSRLDLANRDSQSDAQLAGAIADIMFDWLTQMAAPQPK